MNIIIYNININVFIIEPAIELEKFSVHDLLVESMVESIMS